MRNIYENISENLIRLRKSKNLTQAEFAEIVNYSDKSVSKWETGMSIPSVETLYEIAKFYNVTIDDLCSSSIDKDILAETESIKNGNRIVITLLSITFVWLIALLVYCFEYINNNNHLWIAFIWAIPVTFLTIFILSLIWKKKNIQYISVSIFMWTLITAIFLQLGNKIYFLLFVLGIPIQVIIILSNGLRPETIQAVMKQLEHARQKQKEKKIMKKEIKTLKKEEKSI